MIIYYKMCFSLASRKLKTGMQRIFTTLPIRSIEHVSRWFDHFWRWEAVYIISNIIAAGKQRGVKWILAFFKTVLPPPPYFSPRQLWKKPIFKHQQCLLATQKEPFFCRRQVKKNLPCRNNLLFLSSNEERAFVPVLARLIFSLVPPPRSPPFFRSCCNHHDLAWGLRVFVSFGYGWQEKWNSATGANGRFPRRNNNKNFVFCFL